MRQGDLFSEGDRRKEAGVAQVLANTPEEYQAMFLDTARRLASAGERFTSEDITDIVKYPPAHSSSIGANMLRSARILKLKTFGWVKSRNPDSHSAVLRIWGW